ncbi:MAG: delta-60 repeat domain-containing protein [Flavobacteriales bacterium]
MSGGCLLRTISSTAALLPAVLVIAQVPFQLDPDFRTILGSVYVNSLAFLPDGDLLISGQLRFSDEGIQRRTARLNYDGSRDEAYPITGIGGGKLTEWDGRYYVATSQHVRRILPSGQADNLFQDPNADPLFGSLQGGDYHVYPDGRVLLSGAHTVDDPAHGFDGLYNLIWFTNTGWLDTTKQHRTSDGVVFEFEEQPDGKFLCTGTMFTYEGVPVSRIFRVHPDGSLDTTFSVPIDTWGEAFAFHTLPDGKILAGGVFRNQAQNDTLCLLRLLPNGDLDPSFAEVRCKATFGEIPLGYLLDIDVLPDDRILIAGRFDRVNGAVRGGIALLNGDGSLSDDAFTGEGCGLFVDDFGFRYKGISNVVPEPGGGFYIVGAYHGYDDGTQSYPDQRFITRLYGLDVGVREQERLRFALAPNPASGTAMLQLQDVPAQSRVLLRDALGRTVLHVPVQQTTTALPLAGLAAGVHVVELWSGARRLGYERLVVVP